MDYRYSFDVKENMAKAVIRNVGISTKHAVEVCRFVRGKPVERAKTMLEAVVNKKQAVPFKRYYHNVGFKRKIGPGRYPVKAAAEILRLINNASNNAQLKGLATGKLEICHIATKKGSNIMHRGRLTRRKMKQCSVEIVVKEMAKKKAEETKAKDAKKAEPVKKVEPKPAPKKEEPKEPKKEKKVKEVKKPEPKQEKKAVNVEKKTEQKGAPEKKSVKADKKPKTEK
jgi:large subunit ribosomal protein L22